MTLLNAETGIYEGAVVSYEPLSIYAGLLGQIGDIMMYTATARRIKELFPNSRLTWAVSEKYREAGELVAGLPYVDRLFVTQHYFEKLTPRLFQPWERGWPLDLRGEDEIVEQRRHDLVLETRPRHRRPRWWERAHQVEELAHQVGVPGPIDLQTEVAIPSGTVIPQVVVGKIIVHNDPTTDPVKAWPWEYVREFAARWEANDLVLLGRPGPEVSGVLDLRGRTTLAQAAAIIASGRGYLGIDSGLMWIAGSLQVPTVGLYGTSYIPAYGAIQPVNPRAAYLQAEGALDRIPTAAVIEWLRHVLAAGEAGKAPDRGQVFQ
jgi:ADP-heptose:LPS heptosyltransferase